MRIMKKLGLTFVQQHSIHATKSRVERIHVYGDQTGATEECCVQDYPVASSPDVGDAAWNKNAHQTSAALECVIFYPGDAVWDRNIRQGTAEGEAVPSDAIKAVAERHIHQVCAIEEREAPHFDHAVRNADAFQCRAPKEGPVTNVRDAVGNHDGGEA